MLSTAVCPLRPAACMPVTPVGLARRASWVGGRGSTLLRGLGGLLVFCAIVSVIVPHPTLFSRTSFLRLIPRCPVSSRQQRWIMCVSAMRAAGRGGSSWQTSARVGMFAADGKFHTTAKVWDVDRITALGPETDPVLACSGASARAIGCRRRQGAKVGDRVWIYAHKKAVCGWQTVAVPNTRSKATPREGVQFGLIS